MLTKHGPMRWRIGPFSKGKTMQMPKSYIQKDIVLILRTEGSQYPDTLFKYFSDVSSREEFKVAVNDLLKSGTIIIDNFDKLKLN